MCIFHKWKPHFVLVPRHWVQFQRLVTPSLFTGPPYLMEIPGVGYWSTKKLVGHRCTRCGKKKGAK